MIGFYSHCRTTEPATIDDIKQIIVAEGHRPHFRIFTPMPFFDLMSVPLIEPVPGCRMRTPHGQNLMLSYLEMDDGAEVPMHHHPHEQGGILLKGRVQLTIGEETRVVDAGSLFIIPPNVSHRAIAVDGPAVVLDVFSPVREDYAVLANRYIPPLR